LVALVAGCSTFPFRAPLRVGVTPDYPPVVTKNKGIIEGLEAELAFLLAKELHRPLEFVELRWDQQIPALLNGDIDMIMSGMSVTEERRTRIDFCEPYMKSGLMALGRRKELQRYRSWERIVKCGDEIGVKKGTTGDVFVEKNCTGSRRVLYTVPNDAALALRRRDIDLFIHDAPCVQWLASKYEADLAVVPLLLTQEDIAWGVNPRNPELKKRVNAVLEKWKANGSLMEIVKRWIPAVE